MAVPFGPIGTTATPPTTTVTTRQKIAPVNSALIASMRVRDPRLMRQPTQQSGQANVQAPQILTGQKLINETNGPRE